MVNKESSKENGACASHKARRVREVLTHIDPKPVAKAAAILMLVAAPFLQGCLAVGTPRCRGFYGISVPFVFVGIGVDKPGECR